MRIAKLIVTSTVFAVVIFLNTALYQKNTAEYGKANKMTDRCHEITDLEKRTMDILRDLLLEDSLDDSRIYREESHDGNYINNPGQTPEIIILPSLILNNELIYIDRLYQITMFENLRICEVENQVSPD